MSTAKFPHGLSAAPVLQYRYREVMVCVLPKWLITGAVCAAICLTAAAPAFAHCRNRSVSETRCPVCTIEDCSETGLHCHDDRWYCGWDHQGDFCDGSCQANRDAGHHHGNGHHGCRQ